jgi:hypothetical protein
VPTIRVSHSARGLCLKRIQDPLALTVGRHHRGNVVCANGYRKRLYNELATLNAGIRWLPQAALPLKASVRFVNDSAPRVGTPTRSLRTKLTGRAARGIAAGSVLSGLNGHSRRDENRNQMVEVALFVYSTHHWRLNGTERFEVKNCIDLDLNFLGERIIQACAHPLFWHQYFCSYH